MDINYLLFLQGIRESMGAFGDDLFCFISDFGASSLAVIIVGILYWSVNKKMGSQIAVNLAIATFFSMVLKNMFSVYRPWIKDVRIKPSDKAIEAAAGYSFPSGHSQVAMNIYGTAFTFAKKKWVKVLMASMVFLIAFSRNFLGVHTPQDVLVGLAVGLLSIFLVRHLIDWMDQGEGQTRSWLFTIATFILVTILLVYLNCKSYPMDYVDGILLVDPVEMIEVCFSVAGVTLGVVLGWALERKYVGFSTDVNMKTRILRSVVGAVILIIINSLTKPLVAPFDPRLGNTISSFISLFYALFIWPLIFHTVEKKVAMKDVKTH